MKLKFIIMKFIIFVSLLLCSFKVFSQEIENDQESSITISSNKTAWLLTSNFTVPTVIFQPVLQDFREKNIGTERGNLSFFNSIGAGISVSRADFKIIASENDTKGTDIRNQFGFQAGFLFGRTATGTEDKNRFALQMGISILDFQIGFGKEFISVPKNFNSKFITISYGIPVSKLSKNTAYVFKNKGSKGLRNLTKVDKGFSI